MFSCIFELITVIFDGTTFSRQVAECGRTEGKERRAKRNRTTLVLVMMLHIASVRYALRFALNNSENGFETKNQGIHLSR